MTKIIYTSRTPIQLYQRCKRLRWLSTSEGAAGVGLEPKQKSIHLVIGSAVHAGTEVLLRDGQQFLDQFVLDHDQSDVQACIEVLFEGVCLVGERAMKNCRVIEDRAVAAALADLSAEMNEGVELDPEEQAAAQAAQQAAKQADGTAAPEVDMGGLVPGESSNSRQEDSPIIIDFGDMVPLTVDPASMVIGLPDPLTPQTTMGNVSVHAPGQTPDQYLKEELSSLVEGLVRAWSRRRWRGILTDYIILEVEREGEWKLADLDAICKDCGARESAHQKEFFLDCKCGGTFESREIHFLSRHDALLLERSTGYLYLQSFKTTGAWDRRKEMDAQVDMQGLSEAVDVEKRFREAWELLKAINQTVELNKDNWCGTLGLAATQPMWKRVLELVSERTAIWLNDLPDPPQILGVRYEYLLKGSRRKDKKDAINPDRWVQDSVLCRAYKQEGITSDDRRWAWTYDWQDETGKGRRLDYRSWQKAAVWKTMPIADWIDLLDQGKVQEGALNEQGEALDALASVFVPVITQFRNRDETLDWLEQVSSQEEQIAKDVAEVREAERTGGYAAKRTALNRLFGQNRQSCSYPGICAMRSTPSQAGFCFGAADPFHDPVVLDRFQERVPNHPKEGRVQ